MRVGLLLIQRDRDVGGVVTARVLYTPWSSVILDQLDEQRSREKLWGTKR